MRTIIAASLLLTLLAPLTAAEDTLDANAHARVVAPFLNERTLGIIHVDLTRVDVQALLKRIAQLGKLKPEEIAQPGEQLRILHADLRGAGVKDLYVIMSVDDVSERPHLMVIPVEQGKGKAMATALSGNPLFEELKFELREQVLIAAGEETLKRLSHFKPKLLPNLEQAFSAARGMMVQEVHFIPQDLRRAVEEVMPTLPKELGGGPTRTITRGLQWAALGIEPAPQLTVHLTLQASDAASAKALHKVLLEVYKWVGQQRQIREMAPNVEQLLALLTPMVAEDRLTLRLETRQLTALLEPFVRQMRAAKEFERYSDSLRQIGLALHSYQDASFGFPPAASRDKQQKPLLSWRVHLLPYLDQEELYKKFRLDEPWDSEHNKKLIKEMPKVYAPSVNPKLAQEGKTTYLAPLGKVTMFGKEKGTNFADVTDGTSNTIFIVDVEDTHAVVWTRPEDLKIDAKNTAKGLRNYKGKGYLALYVDGSVRFVPTTLDKATLWALFTRNGGEAVGAP